MKLNIEKLLTDLSVFNTQTLSGIVFFVRYLRDHHRITMMVRNSVKSAKFLLDKCFDLLAEDDSISDVQLAGLLVIVADVELDLFSDLISVVGREASSTSKDLDRYHWSRGMVATYLIHKEVLNETVCKFA